MWGTNRLMALAVTYNGRLFLVLHQPSLSFSLLSISLFSLSPSSCLLFYFYVSLHFCFDCSVSFPYSLCHFSLSFQLLHFSFSVFITFSFLFVCLCGTISISFFIFLSISFLFLFLSLSFLFFRLPFLFLPHCLSYN